MNPSPARPPSAKLLRIGVVLLVLDLLGALAAGLWAMFFSVGTRGQSTEDMIHYNLSSPFTASIAYGPLLVTLLLGIAALACIVVGGIHSVLGHRPRVS